jgi:hypothetical protein
LHVLGDLPRRNPLPAVFSGEPDQNPQPDVAETGQPHMTTLFNRHF